MGIQLKKGGTAPNFPPMSVVAKWLHGLIKMPLGTEVVLGLGNIVLDVVPAPPKKGTAPTFLPMSIVAKRLDGSGCHLVLR